MLNKKNKKLKVGFFSLTSCEGCYFAVLDLRERFLALKNRLDFREFRLFEDDQNFEHENLDLALIEGSPVTKANFDAVKRIRQTARLVVAFGACAHLGGIYHMKNYQDKEKIFNQVYSGVEGVENPDIVPLRKLIKVDCVIPGCPINGEEFLKMIEKIIIGAEPKITQNPVCYECQSRGYECLLQKGEICLGPITQGGCEAICLKSKQGCWGCRGLVEDVEVANLITKLKENHKEKEIIKCLEVFGVKEEVNSHGA